MKNILFMKLFKHMEKDKPGGSRYFQEIAEARIEAQKKRISIPSQPLDGSDFGDNDLNKIARALGISAEPPENNGRSAFPQRQINDLFKNLK